MNFDQMEAAFRAFCRRRPFRPFIIEFASGAQVVVSHPDAIRFEEICYLVRVPDGGWMVFAPESVSRLLDAPKPLK